MHELGPIPRLQTERLILRPFALYDTKVYYAKCSEPEVLYGTDMPHDLSLQSAREWIISHPEAWQHRRELFLLATDKVTREVVGSVSLFTFDRHQKADLGYWIDKDWWGKGLASEMCYVTVRYAFEVMKLHRLEANHLTRNPASGRVLEKLGFQVEGTHRHAYLKDGSFEDLRYYGLLGEDFLKKLRS